MGKRPSFGRSKSERGLDQFDTPPIALTPLFVHEPLLADAKAISEPFCGKGNLVIAMRLYGIDVYASDIEDRGCPGSEILDFFNMEHRPGDCDVLVSNPPFAEAMRIIEHAFALGFRIIVLLLKANFTSTAERYERLHKLGHLRRVHVLAERLQDMHDANSTGEKASQSQDHAWFVLDRNYCGPSTIIPVSINDPTARMPWQTGAVCEQCRKAYQPQRSTARFCSPACKQQAYRDRLSVTPSVTTPAPLPDTPTESPESGEMFRYVRYDDIERLEAEGWEVLPALDGTHHAAYAVLMRRRSQQDERPLIG